LKIKLIFVLGGSVAKRAGGCMTHYLLTVNPVEVI